MADKESAWNQHLDWIDYKDAFVKQKEKWADCKDNCGVIKEMYDRAVVLPEQVFNTLEKSFENVTGDRGILGGNIDAFLRTGTLFQNDAFVDAHPSEIGPVHGISATGSVFIAMHTRSFGDIEYWVAHETIHIFYPEIQRNENLINFMTHQVLGRGPYGT